MLDHPGLLLCCDGSGQATQAIEFAAALFPHGTRATVLYAWEPTALAVAGGMAAVAIPPDADEQDEARAARLAEARARHARDLGLDAEARNEPATASAWRTIGDVSSPFGRGSRHGAPLRAELGAGDDEDRADRVLSDMVRGAAQQQRLDALSPRVPTTMTSLSPSAGSSSRSRQSRLARPPSSPSRAQSSRRPICSSGACAAQSSRRQTGRWELVLDRLGFIGDATEGPHR
jgi:hypothetical protein